MAAFDPPRLGGYTFANPPDSMILTTEPIQQLNELADGSTRQRILGYRYRATLTWDSNWIRTQDLTGIRAVANDVTAALTFIPRPVKYASRTYTVVWTNKFDFSYAAGRYDLYGGSIELVTTTTTSTVTDLP